MGKKQGKGLKKERKAPEKEESMKLPPLTQTDIKGFIDRFRSDVDRKRKEYVSYAKKFRP